MKIAIMQPYFFPYIGYFQLINAVDKFVIYDNIKFAKKGWIQRNRLLVNGKDELFSIPIKKDSDYLNINERKLSDDYLQINLKTLRLIESTYKKAPFFEEVYPLIQECFLYEEHNNLFEFISHSLKKTIDYLKIETKILISSRISDTNHLFKGKERVVEICNQLGATKYINPIGGVSLYDKNDFELNGLSLKFIETNELVYNQFQNQFVPFLSILDVLMFNSKEDIYKFLFKYDLK